MSMTITQMLCNPGNYTAKRTGATPGVFFDRTVIQKITVDTKLAVGQLLIVGNQLRWVIQSANYAARPCNYVVEVMW